MILIFNFTFFLLLNQDLIDPQSLERAPGTEWFACLTDARPASRRPLATHVVH